jgi:hypothetical protein
LPADRAAVIRERYYNSRTYDAIAGGLMFKPQRVRVLERQALQEMRNARALQAFREDIISTWAYKGTGLSAFKHSGQSSVERVVIKLMSARRTRYEGSRGFAQN